MLRVCLGDSSMCLGVSFIAPRQLGAVGGNLGRLILPSVGWWTGQSGAPPNSHCSCPVRDLLPFLAHPTVADSWQLAHRTLSGAHRTVRCPLLTVGAPTRHAKIARPTVGAIDCWLTGQSGEFYPYTADPFPESADFAADDSPDSPVHHRTVR
jgi:hypothetical protein